MSVVNEWKSGSGAAALRRRLDMAVREKNRFMAMRIAQTELARAHQAQVAQSLMADPRVEVVQVMMNPTHPRRDICDLHSTADLWGLGAGCYPKAKAPRPPFHPFCLCRLRQRPSLRATMAKQAPAGEAAYLRSLGKLSLAGQVMGSKAKAEAVLNGAPFDEVVNTGRDPLYRLVRLMDGVGTPESPTMTHPNALPNHKNAVVPIAKIRDYALNQDHPIGGHKARVIAAVLGFTLDNSADFEAAIRSGLLISPAVEREMKPYGREFTVDMSMAGPVGSGIVRTGWMIRNGEEIPRLTSVYVKR